MIKQPPEHAADATPLYIAEFDDALDEDRIAKERKALKKGEAHCVDRYYRGETRYDLDAPHTVGGITTCMRDYVRHDAKPTVFKLRRVSGVLYEQTMAVIAADGDPEKKTDPGDRVAALWKLAQHGVFEVTDGFTGDAWKLDGGQGGHALTGDDMQKLFEAEGNLPRSLGWAVFRASAPLSEVEKNP